MKKILPLQYYFRFAFSCQRMAVLPTPGPTWTDLPETCAVPYFGAVDEEKERFEARVAWNDSGIALRWRTKGRRRPLPNRSAGLGDERLELWLDMRDTRAIQRATKFCHHWVIRVNGESPTGADARWMPIPRANEASPAPPPELAKAACFPLDAKGRPLPTGKLSDAVDYLVAALLPATALAGFDPDANSRLGFFYRVHDLELGTQTLTGGDEFPFWENPSQWAVMELTK